MRDLLKSFNFSLSSLIHYLPHLIGGIVCFIATLFVANFLSKLISKYSLRRTKDSLVSNFIGKIAWGVIFILGTVLALGILGLGTISNKILAGAGITTFIVGFALKDIGENFLSGLLLAFSRPYHVGSLIECEDVKGIVKDMTLRQTTIEAEDGKTVLVPNSMIIKNPLSKYTTLETLSQEFTVNVDINDARKSIDTIKETVLRFDHVLKTPEKQVKVVTDGANNEKIKLSVIFWFDTTKLKRSRSETRSDIILASLEALHKAGVKFSG